MKKALIALLGFCLAIAGAADARLLVKANPGYTLARLDSELRQHGGNRIGHLRGIDVHVIEAQGSELALLKALRSNRHIKYAELDVAVPPGLTVNDPLLSSQWHLATLHAPAAWDSRTGIGVTIAILDSGVSPHPDLIPRLIAGWNTFDNNSNTADVSGHGTKTAGTAAAAGNNGVGVAGVAFGSLIMPMRITDTAGYGYYSSIASAITWAADRGARVASVSYAPVWGSSAVQSAAQYMRSRGGVVVVSSGNTGALDSTPATNLITVVAASGTTHAVSGFSTYGPAVSVTAPGEGIYTTVLGGSYGAASGTSFSTPLVAGVYALMISANTALQPAQLDSILFATARDIGDPGKDQRAGWGLIDANAPVLAAIGAVVVDGTPPAVLITSPSSGSTVKGLITVSVTATDNVGVIRTELYVGGTLYATDALSPYGYTLDSLNYQDGNLQLQARAFDAAGNVGTASSTLKVQNADRVKGGGKGK